MDKSISKPIKRSHWGEFEDQSEVDLAKDLKVNSKSKLNLNHFEAPPLYQPITGQSKHKRESSKRYIQWFKTPLDTRGQSYMLQSIELMHYKRRMRYMLSAAHSHQNEMQKGNIPETQVLPSPPPAPKRFCSSDGRLVFQEKPSFLGVECSTTNPSCASTSTRKKSGEYKHFQLPIELDSLSVRQLLMKSVAAVCAHSGFESANETALNTLTDVTTEYQFQMCVRLKSFIEKQTLNENNIDTFIRVFRQSCSEDLLSLKNYWIERIKNVALKLEKEDRQLFEEYNSLKESTSQSVVVKEEKG